MQVVRGREQAAEGAGLFPKRTAPNSQADGSEFFAARWILQVMVVYTEP
jgi:hypothetical protein